MFDLKKDHISSKRMFERKNDRDWCDSLYESFYKQYNVYTNKDINVRSHVMLD